MADSSNVGVVITVVAATPATIDAAGFGALSWTATLGELAMFGEVGDKSASVDIPRVSGRTTHVNGAVDGGEIPFAVHYELTDAGQVIMRANANGATTVSFRKTYPDGKIIYFYGKLANVVYNEVSPTTNKGMKGVVRVNSAIVTV